MEGIRLPLPRTAPAGPPRDAARCPNDPGCTLAEAEAAATAAAVAADVDDDACAVDNAPEGGLERGISAMEGLVNTV